MLKSWIVPDILSMESLCSLHFFQANMLYYCSHYNSPTSVNFQKLFDHIGTEILDAHENWMTILSSSLEKEELRDLKFNLCYQIYNIAKSIDRQGMGTELQQLAGPVWSIQKWNEVSQE